MNETMMMPEKDIPILELLQKRISHPRIQEVIDEISIFESLGANHILMVTGPTGVGKTTLSHSLRRRILKRHAEAMKQDAGFMPVILIEARATSEKDFNWKLFYSDILEQLEGSDGTPSAVAYGVDPITNRLIYHSGKKNTAAGLRKKVEQALLARRVKILMIDEGGHFTNVSDARMKSQTDALKSLSNCADCQLVMFGSYDILDVSRLSAQLARRIKEIHFSRYRHDDIDDCIHFENFLKRIEHDTNGYFGGLLLENAMLLQKNTLGCVGTLMGVIRSFAARAQAKGEVSQRLLELCLVEKKKHDSMLKEIHDGEANFESNSFHYQA